MKGLVAAALILGQAMPVTRLAGGAPGQTAAPRPRPEAQRPLPQSLPVTQIDSGSPAGLDSPRRVSLSFSEPRPLAEVLRLLMTGTPFSLAIDPDVAGAFRGELKQLTLREALNAVLSPAGFEWHLAGTVIRVTRRRTETRQFEVNLPAVQRGLTRTTGDAATAAVSTMLPPEDVFAGLADGVRALLSSEGTVHVNARAGLVQVTDYADRVDRVALYLEAVQARSGRQVRLQARVYEVTLRDAASIDWAAVRERLGMPRERAGAGIAADPAALRAALAQQGDIRVLSAPEVTAMNNEPALLRAGISGVSALTMTVVPQIASDGIVQLSITQAWEELQPGEKLPHTAEADTVTRVTDGGTVVISGLLRTGPLDAASRKRVQAELVVLLRANVVAPAAVTAVAR
jgi:type II secretory pathway component GspD/PulD (secretin)